MNSLVPAGFVLANVPTPLEEQIYPTPMRLLPIASDRRYYVSLGDAQSRNAGNHLGVASQFYNRLAASNPSLKMVPLATDSATAATVRFVQMPRLREMAVTPSVVTLTLGASDLPRLAFGDAGGVCRELRRQGGVFLAMLREVAPRAILIISTLYDPLDGADAVLTEGIERFNETLQELAASHNGTIVDIRGVFAGHGASAGDPLSSTFSTENSDLYLCAGPTLSPVPNAHGAAKFVERLWGCYSAGFGG